MAPQHANSALQKLIRWSRTSVAYAALNMASETDRERFVRDSPLGRALRAKALGIDEEQQARKAPVEITPRDVILAFAPVLAEHTSLNITEIFELAEALATKMDEDLGWTITVQSR